MRTKNAVLSSFMGLIDVLVRLVISLYMRNIFLEGFGTEYLGLFIIFDSIFGMLVALDCGIASSLFLKIYKPIAEKNIENIKSVFALIRIIYVLRAGLVAIIGIVLIFFLPKFIQGSTIPLDLIYKYYIIYLICNSSNYLVIFYQFFLESVQKRYLVNIIGLPIYILQLCIQLFAIKVSHDYTLYLIATAGASVFINLGCMAVTFAKFPYLRSNNKIKEDDKKDIFKLIKMAFHTLSGVVAQYADTILISMFAGLSITGMYGNYKTLNSSINNFINQITASAKDPLRSIISIGDVKKTKESLMNLTFLMFWVGGFCCVSLAGLSNKFITIWLGDEYVLSTVIVVTTCYVLYLSVQSFFLVDSYYTSYCYLNDKKSPMIEIVVNITLSIVLGSYLGIVGIMIGSIAYYIVQTIRRTNELCKVFLDREFFYVLMKRIIKYALAVAIMSIFFGYMADGCLIKEYKKIDFVIYVIFVVISSNVCFWMMFRKSAEYQYFISLANKIIHRENNDI